jgi:hypothetical protein
MIVFINHHIPNRLIESTHRKEKLVVSCIGTSRWVRNGERVVGHPRPDKVRQRRIDKRPCLALFPLCEVRIENSDVATDAVECRCRVDIPYVGQQRMIRQIPPDGRIVDDRLNPELFQVLRVPNTREQQDLRGSYRARG